MNDVIAPSAAPDRAAPDRARRDQVVRAALEPAFWIGPAEQAVPAAGERPAYLLRTEFDVDVVRKTWLTATAEGVYEVFVNGARIDDDELKPGFSSYRARLAAQRTDVTRFLRPGRNAIGVILSDGWFRGRHGFERRPDGFGDRTALLLAVADEAGLVLARSDGGWSWSAGWITRADLMDGQSEDRRLFDPAWARPGAELANAEAVEVRAGSAAAWGLERVVAEDRAPIRRVETLPPRSTTWLGDGSVVVDFGQNLSGWVRLRTLGPAGTTLTLVHGEFLGPDGRVDTDHLRAFRFSDRTLLEAGQIDRVVSAGIDGDVFEPRHTTHGFRYVQIDGFRAEVEVDIEAVVVHSDLARAGSFRTDGVELIRLHDTVEWSFRGNACGIPTDCPQRERSGFTGDWQIFVETASRMFDIDAWSRSWLRDLAADQWSDGRIPTVIPNPAGAQPSGVVFEDLSAGSAGWGDAAVIVPWELWRRTGDRSVIEEFFPAAAAWAGYAAACAAGGRHPDRAAARPQAQPHEEFLWDTGFHFGEWLEPGVVPDPNPRVDQGIVATAFLHRSAHLVARMAQIIGDDAAHRRFSRIAEGALGAWRAEYLCGDGELTVDSQATYTRALAFGLVPAPQRPKAAARLAALVEAAGNTVGTGFLSTGQLLPVLADHGHASAALALLRSHRAPSWLTMLDRGATTMWERWDGVDDGSARGSLNHYSKGAVAAFLHTHLAGLRLPMEPAAEQAGGRLIVVRPLFDPLVSHAASVLELPAGRASVSWRRDREGIRLEIEVPERAVVGLPGRPDEELGSGRHTLRIRSAQPPSSERHSSASSNRATNV